MRTSVAVLICAALFGCSGATHSASRVPAATPSTASAAQAPVHDVTVTQCHAAAVVVVVQNHTTRRMNYRIDVAVENARGAVLNDLFTSDRNVSPGSVESDYLALHELLPLPGSIVPSTTVPKVLRCVARVGRTPA